LAPQSVQIIARGPRAEAEAAAAAIDVDPALEGAAYSILEEDEAAGRWRIDAFPRSEEEAEAPVRAGRFFIYGMHDLGRTPVNAVKLRIEAGAAFGTGHHGTTVGCLMAFDRLLKARRFGRVLDVGCGTGVLAIAAAKCGAQAVVGTDIDPVSVRISRENAALNQARAGFVRADGLDHPAVRSQAPYDLVFANILARPLVGLAQPIRRALAPGGVAILSGLLRSQERMVRAAYLARGFTLDFRLHRDAWATLVLRRR
jgi:ribosomal protein L11 methyltransferase